MSTPPRDGAHSAGILKALREILKLRPSDLIKLTGISNTSVMRWFSGENRISEENWDLLLNYLWEHWRLSEKDLLAPDVIERLENALETWGEYGILEDRPGESGKDTVKLTHYLPTFQPGSPYLVAVLSDPVVLPSDNSPHDLDTASLRHILGSPPAELQIQHSLLAGLMANTEWCKRIGLRWVEVIQLDRVDLPSWAQAPEVYEHLLLQYRDALADGRIAEEVSNAGENAKNSS